MTGEQKKIKENERREAKEFRMINLSD